MMHVNNHQRPGYIFLISVLFVSAIVVSTIGSFTLISIGSLQNGLTFQASAQAMENANTCAEIGLMNLFINSGYTGNESLTLTEGTCEILQPGGYGNSNRTLCVEGISGNHTRRMEVVISSLLPSISVFSWQEVSNITACSY
jgi:hypothetical protein